MRDGIHPNYAQTTITCTCGAVYNVGSTKKNVKIEICGKCHPLYTGQQRTIDSGGRVDRFKKRYGMK